jgi:hypothetical protein
MLHENVRAIIENAKDEKAELPRPLMRELPPADPFPVDALGSLLAPTARAINDIVQAPPAICGQSVLAATTLAVQGHANVELPTGQAKPTSNYFVTVAATGERKSAVDYEALWPLRKREAALREAYNAAKPTYENDKEAWERARDAAIKAKGVKGNRAQMKAALDALGPPPLPPLEPVLTCPEPTYEGLCKLLAIGQPSIGIFAAEGGQFVGGHGMADDAKLRTATGLSALWDGEPIKRIRALDGFVVLPGRRVAMHLMVQPEVGAIWLQDRLLIEQGLLSRILLTAPEAVSGTRIWKDPSPDSAVALKRYGARLLEILECPLPFAPGTRNELAPRRCQRSEADRGHGQGVGEKAVAMTAPLASCCGLGSGRSRQHRPAGRRESAPGAGGRSPKAGAGKWSKSTMTRELAARRAAVTGLG